MLHFGSLWAPCGGKAGSKSARSDPPGPPGSTPGPPGWILEPPGSILEPPDPFFSHPSETLFEKHRFRSEGVHLSPSHDAHPQRENVVFEKKSRKGVQKRGPEAPKSIPEAPDRSSIEKLFLIELG